MIVSLVSGTYNRLNYLRSMVESFRASIGVGTYYEIVLVDGGSTDGTIEWCKAQPDVRLIEQGRLLGAVKAFNEGAYAAIGKYVILANDDIEFLDDSVLYAIRHMEDSPFCGVGCFYQDRGNREFHVEQMPAVKNKRQISIYYGQVCIVRKHLGDKVGWWGDYLHTYGGDNELSCNVWKLGWTVEPISCACIHDVIPNDELRSINNNVQRVGNGNHPDTQAWLDKWTVNRLVGVDLTGIEVPSDDIINSDIVSIDDPLLRVVYLPIYEPGNQLQRHTKRGLREAFANVGMVYEIDYIDALRKSKQYLLDYFYDICTALQPHIVVTQFHDANTITIGDFYKMKNMTTAKFVNWNGDYHPKHLYDQRYMMLLQLFDLAGFVTTAVKEKYDQMKIPWFYWQIGYEGEDVLEGLERTKKHDIVFLANGYSKERLELGKRLRAFSTNTPVNVGLYGYWPKELKPDGESTYDFDTGYRIYANSKIAISDAQWPEAGGYCSNRVFQAMFAGTCLFQQYFEGMEILGLKHLVNCVVWTDYEDLIRIYLQLTEDEMKKIGKRGKKHVEHYHSFDYRVSELLAELQLRELI